jgi:hypothetical protein
MFTLRRVSDGQLPDLLKYIFALKSPRFLGRLPNQLLLVFVILKLPCP